MSSPATATAEASNVSFTDYDLDETELAGTVQWLPPARTTAVTVPRCVQRGQRGEPRGTWGSGWGKCVVYEC